MDNAKVLDIVARGIFNMLGIDPESLKQQQALESSRQARQQPIDVKGQTRITNAKGNLRDFRSPAQSANRRPSLDPVQTRSNAMATPPNRPANGFGSSRGQLNIFGSNPGAQVGNPNPLRAPGIQSQRTNIPKASGALGTVGRGLGAIQLGVMAAEAATAAGYAPGGKNYKEFVRAQDRLPAPKSKPTVKKVKYPTAAETLQNEAPAAPVLPPAPTSPTSQNRQALSSRGQQPAPAPRVKSEREIVNEAYQALRIQLNNGQITPEDFRRQGLAMHRKFFKKDKPVGQPQMTGEGIRR